MNIVHHHHHLLLLLRGRPRRDKTTENKGGMNDWTSINWFSCFALRVSVQSDGPWLKYLRYRSFSFDPSNSSCPATLLWNDRNISISFSRERERRIGEHQQLTNPIWIVNEQTFVAYTHRVACTTRRTDGRMRGKRKEQALSQFILVSLNAFTHTYTNALGWRIFVQGIVHE